MAYNLTLKKLLAPYLLTKSQRVRPLAPASQVAPSTLLNTNSLRDYSDDNEDSPVDDGLRRDFSVRRASPLSDVFDPISTPRSLNQILDLLDHLQLSSSQFSDGIGGGVRRGWEAKETDDGLHIRVDMPGLGKENVKVSVEESTLIIKGEGEKESPEDDDESVRRYGGRVDLPEKVFKLDATKAEMKNGVLKLVVPKVKEEERTDVVHVNVQ